MSIISYIGLGSNINDPIQQVKHAIEEINQLPQTKLIKSSSLYETSPHGPIQQPDFINAVVAIETELALDDLHQALKTIEQQHNRQTNERWGPRSIDCDLLFYDNVQVNTKSLNIPHPRIIERLFVLIPLQEIHPRFRLPNGKLIEEQILLLRQDNDERVEPLVGEEVVSTEQE